MISLDMSTDEGTIWGYISSLDEDNLSNYLNELLEEDPKKKFLKYLRQEIGSGSFTLLRNLEVVDTARGKGVGQSFMDLFLSKAKGPVILVCDNLETQKSGFHLQSWYENFGFEETGHVTKSGPIMILF